MITYLLWIFGLLWLFPLQSDALMTTHMTKRNMIFIKNLLKSKGKDGCVINTFIWIIRLIYKCSNGLLKHIKARNGTTIIWVVNHEEELAELKELFGNNLMGVMTDKPMLLKSFISSEDETIDPKNF